MDAVVRKIKELLQDYLTKYYAFSQNQLEQVLHQESGEKEEIVFAACFDEKVEDEWFKEKLFRILYKIKSLYGDDLEQFRSQIEKIIEAIVIDYIEGASEYWKMNAYRNRYVFELWGHDSLENEPGYDQEFAAERLELELRLLIVGNLNLIRHNQRLFYCQQCGRLTDVEEKQCPKCGRIFLQDLMLDNTI